MRLRNPLDCQRPIQNRLRDFTATGGWLYQPHPSSKPWYYPITLHLEHCQSHCNRLSQQHLQLQHSQLKNTHLDCQPVQKVFFSSPLRLDFNSLNTNGTTTSDRVDCGEDGTRTRNPLLAKQVLYQLSYIPVV